MSAIIKIFILAVLQNISFSIVSRSRNRDNKVYHMVAAIGSNSIYFLTMRELVMSDMTLLLAVPYVIGTVLGSTIGMEVSMKIEKWLGAKADGHLSNK